MKILFVGGGTLGPVMPLMAVARSLRKMKPDASFAWIGTPTGPEGPIIRREQIEFFSLPVAKLDHFISWRWLTFPFDWARARHEAARLIEKIRPDVVVAAGGYTAIPVVLAAAKRGIPCATHQLDLELVRTNEWIAKHCQSVTTSFEYAHAPFGERIHDVQIPTPVAIAGQPLPSRNDAVKHFGFDPSRHVVFVFGGGTGALSINEMMARTKGEWLKIAQVLHGTGIGKGESVKEKGYMSKPLFTEDMREAYAAADVVICRAGMGALSEIAWAKKAAILIPLSDSHQESNARAFEERDAAVVVDQRSAYFDEELLKISALLLQDAAERKKMGERAQRFLPTDDGSEMAKRVLGMGA